MENHRLKEFVQFVQNKVILAVAFAIIKSKPEHISAEQYAEAVQRKYFQLWQKKQDKSVFDEKIISLHRNKIINQIYENLPPSTRQEHKSVNLNEWFPSICEDSPLALSSPEDKADLAPDPDHDPSLENNLEFIQGMVQLKTAVQAHKVISSNQVYSLIQNRFSFIPDEKDEGKNKRICYSEDSGFGEWNLSRRAIGGEDTISTSMFRFLTHSSDTEAIMMKCMRSVLHRVERAVMCHPEESFTMWRGSILEHVSSVLREVSPEPLCAQLLTAFLIATVRHTWTSTQTHKHVIWEYQHNILNEFCCNFSICENVIDFLMGKFKILSEKLEMNARLEDWRDVSEIEKAPHFISLAAELVKKWKSLWEPPEACSSSTAESKCRTVIELWRLRWAPQGQHRPQESATRKADLWREICEKLITSSSEHFPLICFYLWDLISLLDIARPTTNKRNL